MLTTIPEGTPGWVAGVLLGASAALLCASPADAQWVAIHGRVEDSEQRTPLAEVRVFTADSSAVVLTDSLGRFSLLLPPEGPFAVWAGRLGYRTDLFDLGDEAPFQVSVLHLHPEPIALEGVEAVSESAVSRVLGDLRRRRNAYPGLVDALDRTDLDRLARSGTVWDVVRMRSPWVYECASALSGLCARERGRRSLRFGPLELHVRVCVDGRESWGAPDELRGMDAASVAIVEVYEWGRGGIRIYTPGYILSTARRGRRISPFAQFGCG